MGKKKMAKPLPSLSRFLLAVRARALYGTQRPTYFRQAQRSWVIRIFYDLSNNSNQESRPGFIAGLDLKGQRDQGRNLLLKSSVRSRAMRDANRV